MIKIIYILWEWTLGTTKILSLVTVASLVVLAMLIAYSVEAEAHPNKDKNTTKIINLGILQTAAHDFYNFDRCGDDSECAFEKEDGKLNLSTVLYEPKSGDCTFEDAIDEDNEECEMYNDEQIANGGEPRNSENIMIFTASSALGEKYLDLRAKHGEEKAYDKILKKYHKQIKKSIWTNISSKIP